MRWTDLFWLSFILAGLVIVASLASLAAEAGLLTAEAGRLAELAELINN